MSMIAVVAVVAIGATGAFFSDTETSTGNTFTAGAIDLTVDSEQHYNGQECVLGDYDQNPNTPNTGQWVGTGAYPVAGTPCDGTWLATNLGAHKFFDFLDIKPGDEGENTISLHVDSNDAYACVDVNITSNDDMTCTEPELGAGEDPTCLPTPTDLVTTDGELAQNIEFFAWADTGADLDFGDLDDPTEGDNVWQAGELPLFSNLVGPASDVLGGETYTLADSVTGPLAGNTTSYIGLSWCAGNLTVVNPGVLDCDGTQMGNDTQTDSLVADIAFRVEQARNNSAFRCDGSHLVN